MIKNHVHGIGRTGHAAATGTASSLVCYDDMPQLRDIERLLGCRLVAHNVHESRESSRGQHKGPQ